MCGSIGCVGLSETSIVQAPGMEIGYVMRDAVMWEVDTERDARVCNYSRWAKVF
jgi:hypothetical protein